LNMIEEGKFFWDDKDFLVRLPGVHFQCASHPKYFLMCIYWVRYHPGPKSAQHVITIEDEIEGSVLGEIEGTAFEDAFLPMET